MKSASFALLAKKVNTLHSLESLNKVVNYFQQILCVVYQLGTLSLSDPVANTVRPSVDVGEVIMPAQELGTPVAWGLA